MKNMSARTNFNQENFFVRQRKECKSIRTRDKPFLFAQESFIQILPVFNFISFHRLQEIFDTSNPNALEIDSFIHLQNGIRVKLSIRKLRKFVTFSDIRPMPS